MRTRAARRRESAATPRGTGTEARRRVLGLEALPLPAREAVVLLLCPPANRPSYLQTPVDEGFRALPFVSQETLAALKELQLPLGVLGDSRSQKSYIRAKERPTVENMLRQAHALRRAWDLGSLNLGGTDASALTSLSALAGCTSLHTLDLSYCYQVTDVSALAGCATLHTLNLSHCNQLTDVSALAGCASLHTLDLTGAGNVTDLPLSRCATLHTVIAWNCTGLTDVSGLASCAALRVLSLVGCRTDLSGLSAMRGGPGFASLALYT
mmetsp:Transcript_4303/g.12987  ORF Transcript_4303/g.12987 Transcript_4303/m.12987 type:complete len:268 (+) Transcript_4303:1308-2111(+)